MMLLTELRKTTIINSDPINPLDILVVAFSPLENFKTIFACIRFHTYIKCTLHMECPSKTSWNLEPFCPVRFELA